MSDTPAPGGKLRAWLTAAAFVAALAVLLVGAWPWLKVLVTDPRAVRDWMVSFGAWAPVVLIALQALQVVVFAIPGEVTGIASGWVFGFALGSLLSVVGVAIGSAVAFGLARSLGLRFVHRIAGAGVVARFDHLMASPRFIGILFLLFLIPGLPKDILCYVAGLSRIRFTPFLVLSTIARLPGILGASLMGKALFHGEWWLLALVAGAAGLLFAAGWFFREPILKLMEKLTVPPAPETAE